MQEIIDRFEVLYTRAINAAAENKNQRMTLIMSRWWNWYRRTQMTKIGR